MPGIFGIGILLALVPAQAGYEPTDWYPAAVAMLALVFFSAVVIPAGTAAVPRPVLAAVGLFALFTAWTYLSILWADDQGGAWEAANRTLFYLLVFALFGLWAHSAVTAAILVGVWTAGIVVHATVVLVHIDTTDNPGRFFLDDRLVEPAGYVNATPAIWMMALWPAIVLASRRAVPWWLRGLFAGGAVLLADVALLSQSRGAVFSTPVVLAILFLLVPARVRTFAVLVPVVAGIAITSRALLDVETRLGHLSDAAAVAGIAGPPVIAALCVAVVVTLAGFAESRRSDRKEAARRAHKIGGALAIATATAIVLGALIVAGNPATRAQDAWSSFKRGYANTSSGSRLTASGLGSNRYDFYRVGLSEFKAHPIVGLGGDNFLQQYLVSGRSDETPRYPHSWEIRTLAQYGIVGALLLVAALVAAAVAVIRAVRRPDALAAGMAGAAAMVTVYWLVHGSFDWFWEFAGLGAAAFAFLGIACAVTPRAAETEASGRALLAHRWTVAAGIAALLLVGAVLVAPWTSERLTQQAARNWRADPAVAFDQLETAESLNPLTDHPFVIGGTIAVRLDDLPKAQQQFRRAVEVYPEGAYAALELGAIASELGDRTQAVRQLERAVALSPRDPIARGALARARSGKTVSIGSINARILSRARKLAG